MDKKIIATGFMEFISYLPQRNLSVHQQTLLHAAENAQIHTFGWPIGVVFRTDELKPKASAEGIKSIFSSNATGEPYDYWELKKNGDFYLIQSLAEDLRTANSICLDVRIIRIAEAFLHTALLYTILGASLDDQVKIKIRHGGLKGRQLAIADPMRPFFNLSGVKYVSVKNEIENNYSITIVDIKTKLAEYVGDVMTSLSALFDCYPIKMSFVKEIVDKFVSDSKNHRGLMAFLQ